jgi:hypothetical protein
VESGVTIAQSGLDGPNLIPSRIQIFLFSADSESAMDSIQLLISWIPLEIFSEGKVVEI